MVLEKAGRRVDAVALHHELGEPPRLLLLNLRGARVVDVQADRRLHPRGSWPRSALPQRGGPRAHLSRLRLDS